MLHYRNINVIIHTYTDNMHADERQKAVCHT